jgi:hypothetical protein
MSNKTLLKRKAVKRISDTRLVSLPVAAHIYNCMSGANQKKLRARESN